MRGGEEVFWEHDGSTRRRGDSEKTNGLVATRVGTALGNAGPTGRGTTDLACNDLQRIEREPDGGSFAPERIYGRPG